MAAPERRRGGVPIWVPLGLLALTAGVLAGKLGTETHAAGVSVIDVQSFDLRIRRGWMLPDWEARLANFLARADDLSAHDRDQIEALAQELEGLSFVAEVGVPEVIWPDGLSLPVRLHIPAANIRVGSAFLIVSEEGVVLAGASSTPHAAFGLPLPVLGPLDGSCDSLRAGDSLQRADMIDALATARSMWQHLNVDLLADLGRVMIDASDAEAPDGFEGGVRIDLEGRRRIQFGRAARGDPAGELPVAMKWHSVARGIQELRAGGDWDLLDVRWDQPDVHLRVSGETPR
ncbi:MAG: hypothetical protein ACI841_004831 [Planctomycetota bacterium]|jgi:hypothetical protein